MDTEPLIDSSSIILEHNSDAEASNLEIADLILRLKEEPDRKSPRIIRDLSSESLSGMASPHSGGYSDFNGSEDELPDRGAAGVDISRESVKSRSDVLRSIEPTVVTHIMPGNSHYIRTII